MMDSLIIDDNPNVIIETLNGSTTARADIYTTIFFIGVLKYYYYFLKHMNHRELCSR